MRLEVILSPPVPEDVSEVSSPRGLCSPGLLLSVSTVSSPRSAFPQPGGPGGRAGPRLADGSPRAAAWLGCCWGSLRPPLMLLRCFQPPRPCCVLCAPASNVGGCFLPGRCELFCSCKSDGKDRCVFPLSRCRGGSGLGRGPQVVGRTSRAESCGCRSPPAPRAGVPTPQSPLPSFPCAFNPLSISVLCRGSCHLLSDGPTVLPENKG